MAVPYDAFADIYDAWVSSAPITEVNRTFYVEKLSEADSPVVELGVGNGRICLEVARRGKPIVGVDSSPKILELCRRRARELDVLDRVTLVEGDFRDFELSEPAGLITIPFHSIGHLLTLEDKLKAFRRVASQLRPGGRFIFDHFIFDPEYPQAPGVAHLRAESRDPTTGRELFLWEATTRDVEQQRLRVVVFTDEIDDDGFVMERRYRRVDLSWITPEQSRALLEKAGFRIDASFGSFDGEPLTDASTHQIWVAST